MILYTSCVFQVCQRRSPPRFAKICASKEHNVTTLFFHFLPEKLSDTAVEAMKHVGVATDSHMCAKAKSYKRARRPLVASSVLANSFSVGADMLLSW